MFQGYIFWVSTVSQLFIVVVPASVCISLYFGDELNRSATSQRFLARRSRDAASFHRFCRE
jgi:hypothetical protein